MQACRRRLLPPPFVFGKLVPALPPAARLNCASLLPPPFAAAFCFRQACACFAACRKAKLCKPAACRRTVFVPAQACRTPDAAPFLCLRKPAARRTPHLFCACASLPHAGRRTFFEAAAAKDLPPAAPFFFPSYSLGQQSFWPPPQSAHSKKCFRPGDSRACRYKRNDLLCELPVLLECKKKAHVICA